jgi:hypothetical protein
MAVYTTHEHDYARVALAGIRVVNGAVGLAWPLVFARRFADQPGAGAPAVYPLRMFGVRTVMIGFDLLLRDSEVRAHSLRVAPLIHASDMVAAVAAGWSGQLPRRTATIAAGISAVNLGLAIAANRKN